MAVCWTKYQGGDEEEARGTAEQPLSDRPPLIKSREIYRRSNLKTQDNILY